MIGISLSMDAFAVSICKGLSVRQVQLSHALICGAWFGAFQAIMPSFGYFSFGSSTCSTALALGCLYPAGCNRRKHGAAPACAGDELWTTIFPPAMLPLAVATSIDAFAVGVGFAAMEANIVVAALLIGCTTFTLSAIGVKVGAVFGDKYRAVSERICFDLVGF